MRSLGRSGVRTVGRPERAIPAAEFAGQGEGAGITDQGDLLRELVEATEPAGVEGDPDFTTVPSRGMDTLRYSTDLDRIPGPTPPGRVQCTLCELVPRNIVRPCSLPTAPREVAENATGRAVSAGLDPIDTEETLMAIDKPVYTARATSTGGRTGTSRTSDGRLEIDLSTPKELGGDGGPGTNPEQLFAAGYSACFIGALKAVAGRQKIGLPADLSISADVSIGPMTGKEGAFAIEVAMSVSIPGMERGAAEKLVADAHQVCPYSNATRGNVDVTLTLV